MSFHPAVPDFSNSSLLTLEGNNPLSVGVATFHLPHPRTSKLKQTTHCSAAKVGKGRMPRARKARARLRKQNKLRD